MKTWLVRLVVWHTVDAENEEDARWVAFDDLAFGRVSTLDAQVTQVEESSR